jgi:FKBP-type peptidyl-prolyl cis-trans isomerase SlyD
MTLDTVCRDKVVSITYTIHDDQGTLMERVDLPVSYIHGRQHDLFPQIERALDGKGVGANISVELSPDEGFGAHDPSLSFTDDITNVPEELRFVGAELEAQNASGEVLRFVVTDIKENELTVDANHPLAGKTIVFAVNVTDIRDATDDELRAGRPANAHQGLLVQ